MINTKMMCVVIERIKDPGIVNHKGSCVGAERAKEKNSMSAMVSATIEMTRVKTTNFAPTRTAKAPHRDTL